MDRALYIAMAGAAQLTQKLGSVGHALANVDSAGFKRQLEVFSAVPVANTPSRTYSQQVAVGYDLNPGVMQATGRSLDVAVDGAGWLAVKTADGEAYSRDGRLRVGASGFLETATGRQVLGDGGPIAVPAPGNITIGKDGTVSLANPETPNVSTQLGRLKLVNPEAKTLQRGEDGLFRLNAGGTATADATVKVSSGVLEGGNQSPAQAMVEMLNLSRRFEMQMKVVRQVEQNAQRLAQSVALG